MKTLCKTFVRTLGASLLVLAGATAAFAQGADPAADVQEELKQLLQKNSCGACHFIDKRKYGPNFLEVFDKYAQADKATLDKLVTKMREGGSGVWGEDPMPPQPQLSQADAQRMVELILALKPKPK